MTRALVTFTRVLTRVHVKNDKLTARPNFLALKQLSSSSLKNKWLLNYVVSPNIALQEVRVDKFRVKFSLKKSPCSDFTYAQIAILVNSHSMTQSSQEKIETFLWIFSNFVKWNSLKFGIEIRLFAVCRAYGVWTQFARALRFVLLTWVSARTKLLIKARFRRRTCHVPYQMIRLW